MKCPICKKDNNYVTDTHLLLTNDIRRTRKCEECGNTFRTIEFSCEAQENGTSRYKGEMMFKVKSYSYKYPFLEENGDREPKVNDMVDDRKYYDFDQAKDIATVYIKAKRAVLKRAEKRTKKGEFTIKDEGNNIFLIYREDNQNFIAERYEVVQC